MTVKTSSEYMESRIICNGNLSPYIVLVIKSKLKWKTIH